MPGPRLAAFCTSHAPGGISPIAPAETQHGLFSAFSFFLDFSSICCDVCPFGLTYTADGRVPRCGVLVGNFVQYILLYILMVMGASITLLFNGPTSRNVARYISG